MMRLRRGVLSVLVLSIASLPLWASAKLDDVRSPIILLADVYSACLHLILIIETLAASRPLEPRSGCCPQCRFASTAPPAERGSGWRGR